MSLPNDVDTLYNAAVRAHALKEFNTTAEQVLNALLAIDTLVDSALELHQRALLDDDTLRALLSEAEQALKGDNKSV